MRCGGGGRKIIGVIVGRDDGRPATRKEIRQAQKQAQQKREALDREAIPLGGTPSDVLGLSLGLDMGDIREPLGEARRELLRRWYDGNDEAADRDWQETLGSADRLRACGTGWAGQSLGPRLSLGPRGPCGADCAAGGRTGGWTGTEGMIGVHGNNLPGHAMRGQSA